MTHDRESGSGLILFAALSWAAIGLFVEPLLDRGMTPGSIAFWRAALGGACFLAHAMVRGRWAPAGAPRRWLVAFGVVGVGVFYLALPAAIETGGLSLAWLLLYTAPAWVALGAPALLGQPGDRRTAALVGVTVLGVGLVALGGGDGLRVTAAAIAWGLLAGLTYASWYFITGKAGTGPVATGSVALPVGAVVLAPLASWPGERWDVWALLVGLGVLSTWLPALAYYAGMARTSAARASVLATIEPVAALGIALVVFDERLTIVAGVGAVIVLAAAQQAARTPRANRGATDARGRPA